MNRSTYWALVKKVPDQPSCGYTLSLLPESILELTEDGTAFLWPIEPDRSERCRYCIHSRGVPSENFISALCVPPPGSLYPCNFIAALDAEHQDLASYLLDGACQDAGGYFPSLKAFLASYSLSHRDVTIYPLGEHHGISSARMAYAIFLASVPYESY